MEAVTRKLDFVLSTKTPDYLTTFASQVSALRDEAKSNRIGLIERVAYTWFNRFAALRYLDAKGWHPFRARVLTAANETETQPELLKLMRTGALPDELQRHTDVARLNDLLDGRIPTGIPNGDPQGEVYRHLVLATCRYYHSLLPELFEKLDDETELMLPDDLLTEHSVVHGFRTEITDEDCAEVEILGWLYQFYIAEKKDQVMARKSAVPTEDIPAVTQLFTPHWIVRYLVENSLGRLWLLNRPSSRLREQMPYYIDGETETDFLKIKKPEEIRVLDPAVGSGHMLTYAFDLLYAIYEEEGYAPSDITGLILTHNLYGLDIDPRAAQLASLALVLKAREKSRGFFQADKLVRPHILALKNVRFEEGDLREYINALKLGNLFNEPVLQLMRQFEEATNFGSLIQPCLGETEIKCLGRDIEDKDLGNQLFLRETHLKVLHVLEQAEALTQRYHVVVANPPYMGSGGMNAELKLFLKDRFPDAKTDLFACFIERGFTLAKVAGNNALVTMQSWMFLWSFEAMRERTIREKTICTMAHLGARAFGSIGGEVVQTTAFVLQNLASKGHKPVFFRLIDGGENEKRMALANGEQRFDNVRQDEFIQIPGSPIAYWLSESMRAAFQAHRSLAEVARPREGLNTTDNERFLRRWWECGTEAIKFDAHPTDDLAQSGATWFPCQKGGSYRKWFGNNEYLVNWRRSGEEIKNTVIGRYGSASKRVVNEHLYFKAGITWSSISSSALAMRYVPPGYIFETKGNMCFFETELQMRKVLGLCNSCVVNPLIECVSPTLDFHAGPVGKLPVVEDIDEIVIDLTDSAICLARADWDNFETSWDFRDQPLLRPGLKIATLEASWRNWESQSGAAIRRMQELETENNRLFISAYGLDGELQPEVLEDQITLARADLRRDTATFLSYAVGCMMGRYSLDQSGLILADAGDTLVNYFNKVGKTLDQLTFVPDEDGIIPMLDGEWFEDDIVARTREFLRVTFGKSKLNENLRFIEESLGKDLRKYYLTDFYKNHISNERAYGYKKRPIYWLVQSPQRGFSALIYLHRYTRDTMNLVLNRYLRPYQEKLRSRLEHVARVQLDEGVSARDKTVARKESDKLTKILRECEEWERQTILPLAQQRLELDLDDGVKVNYQKLGEALAPIPGLAAAED
jgi:hypothetical protein